MYEPPAYLWVITFAGVIGILGLTCSALVPAGRRAVPVGAALLLGGWCAASAVIAGHGWYDTKLGHQPPWLLIAFLATLVAALAATRIPLVANALATPGALRRLALPHTFRVAGVAFLISMALGHLPALFALPAGLGDIATGIAAFFAGRGTGRRNLLWFNALGIADLVVAVLLGTLTGFQLVNVTPSGVAITELPLALIPTVAVPVLLALHITSLRRPAMAGRARRSSAILGSDLAAPGLR